ALRQGHYLTDRHLVDLLHRISQRDGQSMSIALGPRHYDDPARFLILQIGNIDHRIHLSLIRIEAAVLLDVRHFTDHCDPLLLRLILADDANPLSDGVLSRPILASKALVNNRDLLSLFAIVISKGPPPQHRDREQSKVLRTDLHAGYGGTVVRIRGRL